MSDTCRAPREGVVAEMFSFGSKDLEPKEIWQDREIRFDISSSELQPRPGEVLIDELVRGDCGGGGGGSGGVRGEVTSW